MSTSGYIASFERTEKKYLVSEEQYGRLRAFLESRTVPDVYGHTEIYNIYYDTPDFLLIRRSLDKPVFKEKLRLRTYGKPTEASPAFIEVKRKYNDTVYKRRFSLPYDSALKYMATREAPGTDAQSTQITREIDYALRLYRGICPAMMITYDRIARVGADDPTLRITFDKDIRWRSDSLDLMLSGADTQLLAPGQRLMEIKFSGALPLWLSRKLTELSLTPTSFSKYGRAFERLIAKNGYKIPPHTAIQERNAI